MAKSRPVSRSVRLTSTLCILALWMNQSILPCASQQTQTADATQTQQLTTEEHLLTLTNQQLEDICTERGFYLEPEEGFSVDDYSHEEYVDAALQCLALEAEIEAAIAENPEILEELKREAERMKEENEKLEAEVMRLLKENDAEQPPSDGAASATTAAFVGEASGAADKSSSYNSEAAGDPVGTEEGIASDPDAADVGNLDADDEVIEEEESSSVTAASIPEALPNEDNTGGAVNEEILDLEARESESSSANDASLPDDAPSDGTSVAADSDGSGDDDSNIWRTLVQKYEHERVIIEKWLAMIDPVLSPVIAVLRATLASMRDMGNRYTAAIIRMNEQRQAQENEAKD